MTMRKIHALVEFVADVPDGDLEGDDHADRTSDYIVAAVKDVPTLVPDSVAVVDWTQVGPTLD